MMKINTNQFVAIKENYKRVKSEYKANDISKKEYKETKMIYRKAKDNYLICISEAAIKIQSQRRLILAMRKVAELKKKLDIEHEIDESVNQQRLELNNAPEILSEIPSEIQTDLSTEVSPKIQPNIPSKRTPTNKQIEKMGKQLEMDIKKASVNEPSSKSSNSTPWLVYNEEPSKEQEDENSKTDFHLDLNQRILRLNQQAIESMKDNHDDVARKIFTIIHQLIEANSKSKEMKESDEEDFRVIQMSYLNNRACMCRKNKRYFNAMEFLQQALISGRKINNRERRLSEILPVLTNLACISSLRKRHLEAVGYAARAVLITTSIGNIDLVPAEQQVVCLFNLSAEMEHLGGATKSFVGNVYYEALKKSTESLGKSHALTKQIENACK
jgi:hypothetical protein